MPQFWLTCHRNDQTQDSGQTEDELSSQGSAAAGSCRRLSTGLALNWDVGFPCYIVSFPLNFCNARCTTPAPLSVTLEAYVKLYAYFYHLSPEVWSSFKLMSSCKSCVSFFVSKILSFICLISFLGYFLFSLLLSFCNVDCDVQGHEYLKW